MKKQLLLLVVMLLPMFTWADPVEIDGIYYNLISNNGINIAEVTSNPNTYQGIVAIPETFSYKGVDYSVTSINEKAFYGCSALISITIPNSVTSIGNGAFLGCSGLISVRIGNSVTSIGQGAFSECSNLTSLTIPNSVTYIGPVAFARSGLTSITIPDKITTIEYQTFAGCSNLTSVTIPNSVTSIGSYAFNDCKNLKAVDIPSSVTLIDNGAFWCFSPDLTINIKNLTAWCNLEYLGISQFQEHHLKLNGEEIYDLIIPEDVTSISKQAFYNCISIKSVKIHSNVTLIANGAFEGCGNLTNIIVDEGNLTYDSRNNCNAIIETASNTLVAGFKNTLIPSSVTSIGNLAFYGRTNLTTFEIPNWVKSIGKLAFYNCPHLFSVTLPNVTSIGEYAFAYCNELMDFVMPSSLQFIGQGVFYNSLKLRNIYCYAEIVPQTETKLCDDYFAKFITLHVPASVIDAYKMTPLWNYFGNIVKLTDSDPKPTFIKTNRTDVGNTKDTYSLNGYRIVKPQNGLKIVRMSDGTMKKVIMK